MTGAQIDLWAGQIIQRVCDKQHVEESRVEVKREWPPDHYKIARIIAGTANAARGEPIMLLIGLDEKAGEVVGVSNVNAADWWMQVAKHFDGPVPRMIDRIYMHEGKPVVVMQFDTDDGFYVVTNPSGGQHEVPWRTASGTFTARHSDLLSVLLPRVIVPGCDALGGRVVFAMPNPMAATSDRVLSAELVLYLWPRQQTSVAMPTHRCSLEVRLDHADPWVTLDNLDFKARSERASATSSDLLLFGPAVVRAQGSVRIPKEQQPKLGVSADLRLTLGIVDVERPLVITVQLPQASSTPERTEWMTQ